MHLEPAPTHEPGYPGCANRRQWLKTWVFIWPARVSAAVCLALLLAHGPALAQESPPKSPLTESCETTPLHPGNPAVAIPPCRGKIALPDPPPCRGDMAAPPQPPDQPFPPPCAGSPRMDPEPFSYRSLSLSEYHQDAGDLVGQRVQISGRLEKNGDGNLAWDGFYLTGEPAPSSPGRWLGCPLLGSHPELKPGAQVLVRGVVQRITLDPSRHGRSGNVIAVALESVSPQP